MKKKIFITGFLLLFMAGICLPLLSGADDREYSVSPVLHNGKKWRIGYIEGGEYADYRIVLKVIVTSLADLGFV